MTKEERFCNELYLNLKCAFTKIPDSKINEVVQCRIEIQPDIDFVLKDMRLVYMDAAFVELGLYCNGFYSDVNDIGQIKDNLSCVKEYWAYYKENNIHLMDLENCPTFKDWLDELNCYPSSYESYLLRVGIEALNNLEVQQYSNVAQKLCDFWELKFPNILSNLIKKLFDEAFILRQFGKEIQVSFDYYEGITLHGVISSKNEMNVYEIYPENLS